MDIWLMMLFMGLSIKNEYKHNKLKQELSKKNEALDNEISSLYVKIDELEKRNIQYGFK